MSFCCDCRYRESAPLLGRWACAQCYMLQALGSLLGAVALAATVYMQRLAL